jgi:hypothetical protein
MPGAGFTGSLKKSYTARGATVTTEPAAGSERFRNACAPAGAAKTSAPAATQKRAKSAARAPCR